jgi:hypothetical protein
MTETDDCIKALWEAYFEMELGHLHKAAELLKKYERKEWEEVIQDPKFPKPLSLHENIDYVRKILKTTVQFTSQKEAYVRLEDLPKDADFFRYQDVINTSTRCVPSHQVIETYICRRGMDYRFETAPNPIEALRNRRDDNTDVGRKPCAAESTGFTCNK